MARSIASAAEEAGDTVARFAPALAATGRSSLAGALDELVRERNSVHGNRPQTDAAYADRVLDVMPRLELALDGASFLVRSRLLWIDDVRPVETPGDPLFQVSAEQAMGDHPDWDVTELSLPSVVFEERFYLQLDGNPTPLALSPFLLALRCRDCQQRHLYYPDKIQNRKTVLNSIDRGHRREDTDEALLQQLRAAVVPPASKA